MPRTTLLIVAIMWHFSAFSQLNITSTTFQGKTYKVYPVRLPVPDVDFGLYEWIEFEGYNYSSNRKKRKKNKRDYLWESGLNEQQLPFNPFKIPDGEYLVYFEKQEGIWDEKLRTMVLSHEDTTLLAAICNISNNKRSGKATWYDPYENDRIIQTGYYKEGEKHGEWTIYRQNKSQVYHYEEGLKQGLDMTYTKGKLTTESKWERGMLDGEKIDFIDYQKQKIASKERYESGYLIESKTFDKKGQLTYWFNRNNTDNILSKYYTDGRLYKVVYETDTIGGYKIQEWSKDGKLVYSAYKKQQWTDNKKMYEQPWYNDNIRALIRRIDNNDEIAVETYFDNGELRIKYDVRTDDLTKPINIYNKKGQLTEQYYLDNSDSFLIHRVEYQPKLGFAEVKHVSYLSSDWIYRVDLDENGDTLYYRADPVFLSIKNKNKTGFIQSSYYPSKHKIIKEYNLLHSGLGITSFNYKGRPVLTAQFNYVNDTTVEVVQSEFDKDQLFEIEHKANYRLPTYNEAKASGMRYSENSIVAVTNILDTYDSLDYRIKFLGELYGGFIYVDEKWNKKFDRYKVKLEIDKEKIDGEVYYDTAINLSSYVDGYHSWRNTIKASYGQVTKITSGYSSEATYVDSKKHGECRDKNGYTGNYRYGLRHGVYKNSNMLAEYYQGLKHGLDLKFGYYSQSTRYDHQLEYKTTFVMDTLHGLFQSFAEPELVSQTVFFDKGFPNGEYWRGNVNSPTEVRVNLNNGFMIDTGYYYFKEGTIKAKVNYRMEDSVFYLSSTARPLCLTGANVDLTRYSTHYYRSESFLSKDKLIDFESYRTGDYEYFYKNGILASKGRIEQKQKVGTWNHWDLNGQLYKQIEYDSGWYINPVTQDSLFYYGKVQMWYPNGKKLLTGLIRSNNMRFKCDQEMKVNMETLYYLSFYEEDGTQTITNGSGNVVEFHNNGEIRLSGSLKNGRRFGLWKEFDPNGRLQSIGHYDEYGFKDGLWVTGDLEAVPYFENLCVEGEVDAYNFPDVDQVGYVTQTISITETHYDHGRRRDYNEMKLFPLF